MVAPGPVIKLIHQLRPVNLKTLREARTRHLTGQLSRVRQDGRIFLYAHGKMGRIMLYRCPSVCLSVRLSEDTLFPRYNSKHFTAIKFIPGIQFPLRPRRNAIYFGVVTLIFQVTEVKKVKLDFQSITPKVFELSTWNLVQTLIMGVERFLFIFGSILG